MSCFSSRSSPTKRPSSIFFVEIVERVLQHRADATIVFRRYEDEAVGLFDFRRSPLLKRIVGIAHRWTPDMPSVAHSEGALRSSHAKPNISIPPYLLGRMLDCRLPPGSAAVGSGSVSRSDSSSRLAISLGEASWLTLRESSLAAHLRAIEWAESTATTDFRKGDSSFTVDLSSPASQYKYKRGTIVSTVAPRSYMPGSVSD